MASISSAESAGGQVGAEHEKDRRAGEDGQLGPDGQEALGPAQQRAGAGIGAGPGDVAVQVDRQAVAKRRPRPEDSLDGHRRRQVATQEHFGLGMNASGVEPVIELARDVPGPLHEQSKRDTAAKQPVNPRDVCSEMAADQDRASAFGRAWREGARSRERRTGSGRLRRSGGRAGSRARETAPCWPPAPARLSRSTSPRRGPRWPARAPRASSLPRRGRTTIASQPRKPRIASPRAGPSPRRAGKSSS